jgi:hypothetical protein
MYKYSIEQALQYLELNSDKIDNNIKTSLISFLRELQLLKQSQLPLDKLPVLAKKQCNNRYLYLLNSSQSKFGIYNATTEEFYGVAYEPFSDANLAIAIKYTDAKPIKCLGYFLPANIHLGLSFGIYCNNCNQPCIEKNGQIYHVDYLTNCNLVPYDMVNNQLINWLINVCKDL